MKEAMNPGGNPNILTVFQLHMYDKVSSEITTGAHITTREAARHNMCSAGL
jgi:hypothetical protein